MKGKGILRWAFIGLLFFVFHGQGWAAFYSDPYRVPLTPATSDWFEYQNKTVGENQDEIALVVDPTNGDKAEAVRRHLQKAGRVVILVGGYGSWGSPSSWMRPIVTYVNDILDAVCIQVNHQDSLSNWYIHSFKRGVDHTLLLALKARAAGAGRVRIYGHSQGSDITGRVVAIMVSSPSLAVHQRDFFSWWYGQGNPGWFEGGFGFGNPAGLGIGGITVTSQVAPPPDQDGRRGGFYRYDWWYNGFWYLGKYVLFNRWSDPATYGGVIDVARYGTSAHDYTGVFSYPDFMAAFEAALYPWRTPTNTSDKSFGYAAYVDRGAGKNYDFTSVHFVPFLPSSQETSHCAITVGNASQDRWNYFIARFHDCHGVFQREQSGWLAPNGSNEVRCPAMGTAGNAVVFVSEPVTAVISDDYDRETIHYGAAYPSEAFPSREVHIPFLAKGWIYGLNSWRQSTEIVLFNPNSGSARANMTYYNATECATNPSTCGAPAQARFSRVIPPFGSVRVPSGGPVDSALPSEWMSSRGWGVLASATVHSDLPLAAMVTNRAGVVSNFTGTVDQVWAEGNYRTFAARGANKVYVPLLKRGTSNSYQTAFIVQNTGEQNLAFVIKYYRSDGGLISTTSEYALSPHTMRVFGPPGQVERDGSAVIEITYPRSGQTLAAVTQTAALNGLEITEGIPDGAGWYQERPDLVYLPLIRAEQGRYDSETNVVNMGSSQQAARVNYYKASGTFFGTSLTKVVSSESSAHFWVGNTYLYGSGTAEGSEHNRSGAAVQINQLDIPTGRDALKGYSGWW